MLQVWPARAFTAGPARCGCCESMPVLLTGCCSSILELIQWQLCLGLPNADETAHHSPILHARHFMASRGPDCAQHATYVAGRKRE